MKARRVKGLDPASGLGDNARRIIATRLDELLALARAARDPDDVKALHDLRIAAKRLRYVLEATEPALGREAGAGAKAARRLQDLLGEIHDCDVLAPRVERHVQRLRVEDAVALREAAGPRARELEPASAREAPNRRLYRGLEALHAYLHARRDVLYARFLRDWSEAAQQRFAAPLRDLCRTR